MFLKRIEAKGFKSFANRTKIIFTDGLTAVVGPNGTGKSNINDAIRWVLGETSKKNLRANDYTDMIFSGADGSSPAPYAEVTLVFNNQKREDLEGSIYGRYLEIDNDEVAIKRIVSRAKSSSEYYINEQLVRRRDVKNLFLGTGLGNLDLSLISQGSVTKITEAKPLDLKDILNEAAGVSRYHQQKNDALQRLERTSQSFEIFNTKLNELKKQLAPLIKQKEKAETYLTIKEQLAQLELPLLKNQLLDNYEQQQSLRELLSTAKTTSNGTDQEMNLLRDRKRNLQQANLEIEEQIQTLELKKSRLSKQKVNPISTDSLEQIEHSIADLRISIASLKQLQATKKADEDLNNNKLIALSQQKFNLENQKRQIDTQITQLEYELEKQQLGREKYSFAIRKILENQDIFDKVYGPIDQLIKYDSKYQQAIKAGLGGKLTNLVVSDETAIKQCLSFLKKNHYGQTTFIPAEKVVPKEISSQYLTGFASFNGFVGTLVNVIKTDKKFINVIKNVAGNILLFTNIEFGLEAAKKSNYKFTIVTLEGDIIYPGFTVRGGSTTDKGNNLIEQITNRLKLLNNNQQSFDNDLVNITNQYETQRQALSTASNEAIRINEKITYSEHDLQNLIQNYRQQTGKDYFTDDSSIDESSAQLSFTLESIESDLNQAHQIRKENSKEILNLEEQINNLQQLWKEAITNESDLKIKLDAVDIHLNEYLKILNVDYQLSYEDLVIKEFPPLTISFEEATLMQRNLRKEIQGLGFINLRAIEEYQLVAKDFEELKQQTEDLENAKTKLISTISELDAIMIERFNKTFEAVNQEFNIVFQTLFFGGYAKLKFLDPENKLDSGIIIEARTPGKQIKSITLYSGGERSLIALSLIFAINSVRKLPILLLDEVEAALDEANVERFASYAKKLNKITQLIITTHRPGTMEAAEALYGVTMEQKGITKIVSVHLHQAKALAEQQIGL